VKVKSAPARLKADGSDVDASGEFEAIVSVFGNTDSWGDVVKHGAFTDTIGHWKASPNTLPVLWSHRMDDPTYNIGEILDIREIGPDSTELPDWVDPAVRKGGGLWVHGRLDTGDDASPIAKQALRLMKARRVTQFSYAYDELESGWGKVDGREVWELRKLKLYEISPTQIGANELTELLAAKALRLKAGEPLSADNEDRIRQASDLLHDVLQSLSTDDTTDSEDDGGDGGKAADTPARKSLDSDRPHLSALRRGILLRQITE
jgi:hypothetical protein